jgi:hypothetical protein
MTKQNLAILASVATIGFGSITAAATWSAPAKSASRAPVAVQFDDPPPVCQILPQGCPPPPPPPDGGTF